MAFGLIDSKYIDFAPGVDNDYLRGLTTRSGVKFTQIVAMVDAAMARINGGFDPFVASLVFPTSKPDAPVQRIGRKVVTRRGEYTMARPQRGEAKTFMLPIDDWDIAIGLTEDGLEEMSLESLKSELDEVVTAVERLHRQQVLERLFSDDEVPVSKHSTHVSPGFAGSGTSHNVFTGFFPDGTAVPNGYSHYAFTNQAGLAAAIKTLTGYLKRWNRKAELDLIAPANLLDQVTNLAGFVPAGSALIRLPQGEAEALVDPAQYVGVLDKRVRVRYPLEDTTDSTLAIYRPGAPLSSDNILAWRYDELKGRDAWVRSRESYPLALANGIQRFGVGAFDRTGAALLHVDNAATEYVAPSFAL